MIIISLNNTNTEIAMEQTAGNCNRALFVLFQLLGDSIQMLTC